MYQKINLSKGMSRGKGVYGGGHFTSDTGIVKTSTVYRMIGSLAIKSAPSSTFFLERDMAMHQAFYLFIF